MSESSPNDLFTEVHDLVTAAALGRIDAEQFRRLEFLLDTSAAARRIYVRYIQDTVGLESMIDADSSDEVIEVREMDLRERELREDAGTPAGKAKSKVPPRKRKRASKKGSSLPDILRGRGPTTAAAVGWIVALCSGLAAVLVLVFAWYASGPDVPGGGQQAQGGPAKASSEASDEAAASRSSAASPRSVAATEAPAAPVGGQVAATFGNKTFERRDEDKPGGQANGPQQVAFGAAVPIAIFDTGAGLDRGAEDGHWELVRDSGDPAFKPKAAVVLNPPASFLREKGNTRWISMNREGKSALDKSAQDKSTKGKRRWTFRTRFDLSGFDADSARITGVIAASERLVDIRVNGMRFPLPDSVKQIQMRNAPAELTFSGSFAAGVNTLEFDVESAEASDNIAGLYVDWSGKARRL